MANFDVFKPKMRCLSIFNVLLKRESYIRAPGLLNDLNSLRKNDNILGKPRILSLSPTHLINSVQHEHGLS